MSLSRTDSLYAALCSIQDIEAVGEKWTEARTKDSSTPRKSFSILEGIHAVVYIRCMVGMPWYVELNPWFLHIYAIDGVQSRFGWCTVSPLFIHSLARDVLRRSVKYSYLCI